MPPPFSLCASVSAKYVAGCSLSLLMKSSNCEKSRASLSMPPTKSPRPRIAWRVCSSPSPMTSIPPLLIGPLRSSGPDQRAPFCLQATMSLDATSHIVHNIAYATITTDTLFLLSVFSRSTCSLVPLPPSLPRYSRTSTLTDSTSVWSHCSPYVLPSSAATLDLRTVLRENRHGG